MKTSLCVLVFSFTTLVMAAAGLAPWAASGHAQQDRQKVVRSTLRQTAPLLKNLGTHRHPVTTTSRLAQRYFNQGLILSYGFNHAEAARSFREAQKLDKTCAMAYWGEALVLGPNINAPMDKENVPRAWSALQQAIALSDGVTPRERDYIQALAKRYAEKPAEDRAPLDQAYAQSMRGLAEKYPNDYDAQTLLAEALMDTTPWDYWLEGGRPKPVTKEILSTLERVLARRPRHPGANHLYIHAVEAAHPQWAVACADRLRNLVPGAGHLAHMPSHIYIRVGRYKDAVLANEKAIAADNDYVAQCHAQGLYPVAYMPHNHHFLWFAASMEGRAKQSIQAAQHMAKHMKQKANQELMRDPSFGALQHFSILPLYAWARFGRWKEILEYPPPKEDLKYPRGIWRFAQGLARRRQGDLASAAEHYEVLKRLAADPDLDKVTIWENNSTRHILRIAEKILAGELAQARGQTEAALEHIKAAVQLEDEMRYEEPQLWHIPTRQTLGAFLLEAKKYSQAENAFRADLKKYPVNGWSLFGLQQALTAQQKTKQAAVVKREFDRAWRRADVQLISPRF